MAKSKSKAKSKPNKSNGKISPERFLKEKARKLPIDKCYMSKDWEKSGLAQVIVSRKRPDGKIAFGFFLVDTYCLGVKDTICKTDFTPDQFSDFIKKVTAHTPLEEVTYNEAHNMVWGAVSFAEDVDIAPYPGFDLAQYILEEDTDEIPLIEYEYGKDGKYFLVIGESGKERKYFNTLREKLGDKFGFMSPVGFLSDDEDDYEDYDDYDDYDDEEVGQTGNDLLSKMMSSLSKEDIEAMMENFEKMNKESRRHKLEKYSYNYPEYPSTLNVKHQFIADAFFNDDYNYSLPEEIIKKILDLPQDEVIDDINNIVLYTIGKTYKAINENAEDIHNEGSPIMHSLLFLTEMQNEKGLGTVLEILKQNGEFSDFHLGDIAPNLLPPALYAVAKDNIPAILEYVYLPGMESYMRQNAIDTLTMIAIQNPKRRGEIIEILRDLLKSMVDRLPRQEACDAELAGFVMSNLIDLNAVELIPEIKEVYATDCVDKAISGDLDSILDDIKDHTLIEDKYEFPDIHKQYEWIKSFER